MQAASAIDVAGSLHAVSAPVTCTASMLDLVQTVDLHRQTSPALAEVQELAQQHSQQAALTVDVAGS